MLECFSLKFSFLIGFLVSLVGFMPMGFIRSMVSIDQGINQLINTTFELSRQM